MSELNTRRGFLAGLGLLPLAGIIGNGEGRSESESDASAVGSYLSNDRDTVYRLDHGKGWKVIIRGDVRKGDRLMMSVRDRDGVLLGIALFVVEEVGDNGDLAIARNTWHLFTMDCWGDPLLPWNAELAKRQLCDRNWWIEQYRKRVEMLESALTECGGRIPDWHFV